MNLKNLESYLISESFLVDSSEKELENVGSINIIKAQKGKLIKKRVIIYCCDIDNESYVNQLIDFIKQDNPKNALCLALCNVRDVNFETTENTMYTGDNGNGVCIIHFVYQTAKNELIYDTDFYYQDSKIIRNIIKYIADDSTVK